MARKGIAKEEETLALFKELEVSGVNYLVIGGMAVAIYGVQRATFDIDVAVAPDARQIEGLVKVLKKLGYTKVCDVESGKFITGIDDITGEKIVKYESVKVTNEQSVDILVVPEDTFDFMWEYRVEVDYEGIKILVPSILDLIRLKEKSKRPVDIDDAKQLRHILRTSRMK